jgi:hypothetical protein
MAELDPRTPHERRYQLPDGRVAVVNTDDRGTVNVTEELLHDLYTRAGFTEITETT